MEEYNTGTFNNPSTTSAMPTTNDQDKEAVEDISARLSSAPPERPKGTDAPKAVEAIPFDIGKLTAEQLSNLKSMLAVTPERVPTKKKNAITQLRSINGKVVVAIKNAYLTLVYDPVRMTDIEAHKIPVRFAGETEFKDVLYNEFMKSERVMCEIMSIRTQEEIRIEGEVVQRETGRLVNQEVKMVIYFFTVKLPDGTITEIEGSAANA